MDKWFTVDRIDEDTYIISEYRHWEETHCYLLNGFGAWRGKVWDWRFIYRNVWSRSVACFLPHPVYAWMGWMCVVNPSEEIFEVCRIFGKPS